MPAEYTLNQVIEKGWPIFVTDDTPGMRQVVMDRPVCVVGARSVVHLPLPSPLISKSHSLMVHDSLGVWLRDLGSKNHTFVNGKSIRETRLRNGDRVRFGPFTFRCAKGFESRSVSEPLLAGELQVEASRTNTARAFSLNKQTCLIGSRYSSDIMIPGDTVSNAHAVVFVRGGRRFLRDLTSISGTLLNGQPCRENELRHGDEIRIATTRIIYHLPEGTIMPGLSSSDDTKVGIPAIFRDVKDVSTPPRSAQQPAQSKSSPAAEIVMPWDRSKPVMIDIEEATRRDNAK